MDTPLQNGMVANSGFEPSSHVHSQQEQQQQAQGVGLTEPGTLV